MAQTIDARVKQKIDTIENWLSNQLIILEGEQCFVGDPNNPNNNAIIFKIGDGTKTFAQLPWPDFTARGRVSPGEWESGRSPGVYIPVADGAYGAETVTLSDGYQVLHWDGSTLAKVVYPVDLAGYTQSGGSTKTAAELDAEKVDKSSVIKSLSDNLFDPDNYVLGALITCSTNSNSDYIRVRDIIPVTPGLYSVTYNGLGHRFTWYIDGVCQGELDPVETYSTYRVYEVPSGGNGVRWNISAIPANHDADRMAMMLVAGNSYPAEYIPYEAAVIGIDGDPIKNADKDVFDKSETYDRTYLDAAIPVIAYESGKNLFNPADPDVVLDHYVSYTNGLIQANAAYNATGYIPVTGGVQYAFSYSNQRAWYDENKVFISGNPPADGNVLTAPANAAYLRASVDKNFWDTFQVEQGSSPTSYEPYAYYAVSSNGAPFRAAGEAPKNVFDANVALPKRLYALVGQEFNLYYDSFNLLPEYGGGVPNFLFDIVCSKGQMRYRSFQFTPTAADVGSYALTFNFLDSNGEVVQTASTVLEVVARTPISSAKNVLILGDSTWHNGGNNTPRGAIVTKTLYEILQDVGGTQPVFFGQQQPAPWHNEARSGRTWGYYAEGGTCYKIHFSGVDPMIDLSNLRAARYYHASTGNQIRAVDRWVVNPDGTGWFVGYTDSGSFTPPSSFPTTMTKADASNPEAAPFPATLTVTNAETLSNFSILKNNDGVGALDIDYYVETVLGQPVGTKIDITVIDLGINDTSSPNADISAIITRAQTLIAAFNAHNPDINIIICYPKSKGSDYFYTGRRRIRFTMQELRKALLDEFDFNPAYPNVYISQSGIGMDRFYAYPTNDVTTSSRLTGTMLATQNDVHPSDEGNLQIADAVSGLFVKLLNS